ncbi:response regulator transcription factor [Robertkochia aurantiaca]|uniref:response regulator transcription factor n=1 Tax=Robertkochia aurantiaca TaxID=2873700 RepID=UPI001CCEC1B3|nr:helix-turn-helix transcriptional regulator [Robertkochia sp. 3YJGBD-33]
MSNYNQYKDIFKTGYDFSGDDIQTHIQKLHELDQLLPPSSTFTMITNTLEGKYDFISKNFEYATGLKRQDFIDKGIPHYLSLIHPDEIQTWLGILQELMAYCTSVYSAEELNKLDFQFNYRLRIGNDTFINILENQVNLKADTDGKPVVGLGHFSVIGDGNPLPIRASVRYLNERKEYETVFDKTYGNLFLEDKISDRERDVIRLLAMGYDNQSIADNLFISAHTVKTHRKNLLNKTQSKNTAQLLVQCMREGLI